MKGRALELAFLFLMFGFGEATAFGQFSSAIEGTVHDPTGAVIAGARVKATDTRLGVSRKTATNDTGFFRVDSVAASTYTIEIEMTGFETWRQAGLVIHAGEVRTLAPELKVGAASANVQVSASEAALDLVTPATASVISDATVQQVPLPGQNVWALSSLTPGMTGSAVTSIDNFQNAFTININAAGLRQEQNGFQVDDAIVNEPSRGGGASISPIPDTIQSIDIRTNDFDAQKGSNAGASAVIYTLSGTNAFHGSLNYYFRNDTLSARTEFETKIPEFHNNEVSATLGGPILKNRLFFLGAVDVLRSSTTSSGQAIFETPDFLDYAKANFPNNTATKAMTLAPPIVAPTSNLQSVGQYEASTPGFFAPPPGIPTTLNVAGTANYSYSTPRNGYQWNIRVDDYLGAKDRVYVSAMRLSTNTRNSSNRPSMSLPYDTPADFINLNWTHTFSRRLINQAGSSMVRPQGAVKAVPALQIPYVSVNGASGFGSWGPGNWAQTTVVWRDVLTAIAGRHTLKFGTDFMNTRENDQQTGAFARPSYNFSSLLDFVQDEAVSESATPVDLKSHKQAEYARRYRELSQAYFIQDDWKVNRKLSLNAGLRFEKMVNFFSILSPQLTNFTLGRGSTWQERVANGAVGLSANDNVLDHDIWSLTPRLGFSWDIFGSGKTALRGGFGMFADQPPYLHVTDLLAGNLPNVFTPSLDVRSGTKPVFQFCDPPTGFRTECPVIDTSNVMLNEAGGVVGQRSNVGGYTLRYKLGQAYEWTLSVQQQVRADLILEMNYSASAVHHLPVYNEDLNRFAGDLITNNGHLQRLNPNFATIPYATSDGNSSGNIGSLSLTRPFSRGLAIRGIYTYGKALDSPLSTSGSIDAGSVVPTTQSGPIYQNGNFHAQRGRSDYDIRQQFSADGVWTLPNDYRSAALRNVLGGWQLGGIWILQTGLPFTVVNTASFSPICSGNATSVNGGCPAGSTITGNIGGDYNADGNNMDMPGVPAFGRHLSGKHKKDYLNGIFGSPANGAAAAQFSAPPLGMQGNLGRNTYDNEGYNNFNLEVEKFFQTPWFFKEKIRFEVKGEFINLFNRVNLTNVSNSISAGNFGQATGQLNPRYIQLHLRTSF